MINKCLAQLAHERFLQFRAANRGRKDWDSRVDGFLDKLWDQCKGSDSNQQRFLHQRGATRVFTMRDGSKLLFIGHLTPSFVWADCSTYWTDSYITVKQQERARRRHWQDISVT